MGCDIHVFAELVVSSGVRAVADGSFTMARSYPLFQALAGVRSSHERFVPLIPPRGLPADVSQEVAGRFYLPVLSAETAALWGHPYASVTPAEADSMVAAGARRPGPGDGTPYLPSEFGYVSNPDFHTPSWLDLDDVRPVLEHAGVALSDCPLEFQWLVEALGLLEPQGRPRLVFWFDN